MRQEISFARSFDGAQVAMARHGHGPPLVRVATWLTHLEHDWASPVWRHWLADLGARFTVVRYDQRGTGLSDRVVGDISLDAWLADLEAVADAARLDRFVLLGMSQAAAVAIAYAARHPERVSRLVLWGGFARGYLRRNPSDEEVEQAQLELALVKLGWGRADPVFRRVFTTAFIPGASETQMRWFDELQRASTSPETAMRIQQASATIDVSADAAALATRALVLHANDDRVVPFEEGRRLAGLIPGAAFVPLEGRDHILLADEPAWPRFLEEVDAFVGRASSAMARGGPIAPLTTRQLEVLRLVAAGRSNEEVAQSLGLSVRTVERHLTNVYDKLSITGKSARAAAAARLADLEIAPV